MRKIKTPMMRLIFEFNRRRSSPEEFAALFHSIADYLVEMEEEIYIAGFIAAAPDEAKTETLREIAKKEFHKTFGEDDKIAGIDFGEALDKLTNLKL